MKHKMILALVLILPGIASATPARPNMAELQKAQIELLLTDMNNSALEVIDTVTSNPQKAIDSGCLDDIRSIDLSVFTIDLTNIWEPIYATLKDQIFNMVCDAAEQHINNITEKLTFDLQGPFGLSSVSVVQGDAISDWQSVTNSDVQLDSTALVQKVSTKTLGTVPTAAQIDAAVKSLDTHAAADAIRGNDKEKLESQFKQMLDLNTFFGSDKKEGDN